MDLGLGRAIGGQRLPAAPVGEATIEYLNVLRPATSSGVPVY